MAATSRASRPDNACRSIFDQQKSSIAKIQKNRKIIGIGAHRGSSQGECKSQATLVIPAKAGIQGVVGLTVSTLRRRAGLAGG